MRFSFCNERVPGWHSNCDRVIETHHADLLNVNTVLSKNYPTALLQLVNVISFIGQGVVLDRSIYSDLVFTNVIFQDGHISRDGMHKSYLYYKTMK